MSKFNAKNKVRSKTINRAGGVAYKESAELELASILLTSMVQDQFYRSKDEALSRVRELLAKVNPYFAAQAAVYARRHFGMRSISHVVAGELAQSIKGETWFKHFIKTVINRPDDAAEILSYFAEQTGGKASSLPRNLKTGLAFGLEKFDEYQLAKYRLEGNEITLVDLFNVLHPKPQRGQASAFKKLMTGKLKGPKTTMQVAISDAGRKAEDDDEKAELKDKAWSKLIKSGKLGYFALLKNLRNILEQSPDSVPAACKMLVDPKLIKSSMVLPFRFMIAIAEIEKCGTSKARPILNALNDAIDIAIDNVPNLTGKTLVVLDDSGSMTDRGKVSGNPDLTPAHIGALFAAVLLKKNDDADFMMFNGDARYVNLNTRDSALTIASRITNQFQGGSTNFSAIFDEMNEAYDRIVILSDEQGWVRGGAPTKAFKEYKDQFGAKPKLYSFDLTGYGDLMFPEQDVYCVAGFSEKVFDLMKALEEDRNALVNKIKSIKFEGRKGIKWQKPKTKTRKSR